MTHINFILNYLPKLLQLQKAYLACTSLLFILEIARFVLNLFSYGDSVNTQNEMSTQTKVFHGLYIAIWCLQGLFHIGFIAVFVCFHIYGAIFYLETRFAAAMVFIFPWIFKHKYFLIFF